MGGEVGFGEPKGRRIGRYDVLLDLGDDGFVTLAVARIRGVHIGPRLVELAKVERSLSREVEIQAAFLAEARAATRVRSSGFIGPTDTLLHDGDLYVAHELVHGARLSEVIKTARARGQSVPVSVAVRMALDLSIALSELHACEGVVWGRPLVHGDVCPDTVLVDFRGATRLVHSGLSIATRRLGMVRRRNDRLAYKAPEQLRGGFSDTIAIDPSVDVYACGVILWELLAGRPLFDASTEGEVAEKVMDGAVPMLPAGLQDPAAGLGAVIAEALERSSAARTASAYDWSARLENAVSLAVASPEEVALFIDGLLGTELERRREQVSALAARTEELAPPSWIAQSVVSSHVRKTASSRPSMSPLRTPRPSAAPPALGATPRNRMLPSAPPPFAATSSGSPPSSPRPTSLTMSRAPQRRMWVDYLVWALAGGSLALFAAVSPLANWLGSDRSSPALVPSASPAVGIGSTGSVVPAWRAVPLSRALGAGSAASPELDASVAPLEPRSRLR